MTQHKFREPSAESPHYVFWLHLKAGRRLWRNDPLTNIQEWLDLEKLHGDPNNIVTYGYKDLSLEGPPIDTSRPLYDSDGYLHTFVDKSRTQIVTKQHGIFAIWDPHTGILLAPDVDGLYLSNFPLSEAELARRSEQGAKLLATLQGNVPPIEP